MSLNYSDYIESCSGVSSDVFGSDQYYTRGKKRFKPVSEKKFNTLKNTIAGQLEKEDYTSREEAQEDLENKIQQMGPVTFFLLRVLIGWIIGKLLDAYFDDKKES